MVEQDRACSDYCVGEGISYAWSAHLLLPELEGLISGKTALVTGGNSGLGFSICLALAKEERACHPDSKRCPERPGVSLAVQRFGYRLVLPHSVVTALPCAFLLEIGEQFHAMRWAWANAAL